MSMSVYAMNYSNQQQNDAKSAVQKTDREEMKQAELQQNVGSVRLTQEKYREDGTISIVQRMQGTEAYRQVKEGQENAGSSDELESGQTYSGTVRRDTAIISEEGRRAYSQMSQQKEEIHGRQDTVQAGANEKQNTVSEEAGMNEKQNITLEEEENTIEDLSEYTDTELKQMYYRGEITLQEYEDETGEVIE